MLGCRVHSAYNICVHTRGDMPLPLGPGQVGQSTKHAGVGGVVVTKCELV